MKKQLSVFKELSYEGKPVHVFEYNGRRAFLAQEIAAVLGIKQPAKSLRASKTLEKGLDYDVVPAKNIELREKFSLGYGKNAPLLAILYESGIFLFILHSNKPIAVPFSRWVIRSAIPSALRRENASVLDVFDTDVTLSLVPQKAAAVHSSVKHRIAETKAYLKKLNDFAKRSEENLVELLTHEATTKTGDPHENSAS